MAQTIEARVHKLVAEQCTVDPSTLHPETRFVEDLNADSLDLAEMTMKVEDEFDISLPDAQAAAIRSIADLIATVRDRTAAP